MSNLITVRAHTDTIDLHFNNNYTFELLKVLLKTLLTEKYLGKEEKLTLKSIREEMKTNHRALLCLISGQFLCMISCTF